jgi:hypothetical protein
MNIAPLAGKGKKESGEEGMRRKGKSARISGTAGNNHPRQGTKSLPALTVALLSLAPAIFAAESPANPGPRALYVVAQHQFDGMGV